MWIDRKIEPLLRQRAATRPVVVLTGARQTGKTSLMRRLPRGGVRVREEGAPYAVAPG